MRPGECYDAPLLDACKLCPLRQCDFLDARCRLSVKALITHRRDLIGVTPKRAKAADGTFDRKAYDRERYLRNREKLKEQSRVYNRKHPHRRQRVWREYYEANKETLCEKARARYHARKAQAI